MAALSCNETKLDLDIGHAPRLSLRLIAWPRLFIDRAAHCIVRNRFRCSNSVHDLTVVIRGYWRKCIGARARMFATCEDERVANRGRLFCHGSIWQAGGLHHTQLVRELDAEVDQVRVTAGEGDGVEVVVIVVCQRQCSR